MPKTNPAKPAPEWGGRAYRPGAHICRALRCEQSALASGYGKGTNANVASRQACLLLRKPRIAEAINQLVQERSGATQSLVLQKLGAIATTDINDVAEVKDGQLVVKDTSELSPEALVAVAGYEVNERGFLNVKLHDRIRALDLLSKILGMKRSVNAEPAPGTNIASQINNTTEASNDVLRKLDAMLPRQRALPAPSQQPMRIDVIPEHEPERVESK